MSAAAEQVRTARFYTSARRLPWVIGKFADWRIPFGPFNAVQIAVMSGGGLLLVKTASLWWSLLGPVPVVGWAAAIFVCRRHKVAGRTPVGAALGVIARAAQPAGGRIAGRAARDRRPQALTGSFSLQSLTIPGTVPATAPIPAAEPERAARRTNAAPATGRGPRPVGPDRPLRAKNASPSRRRHPAARPAPAARRSLSPVQAALLAAKEQS
ncbi:hypothetical protein [Streptomyces sp. NPDC050145]|uniref:hypothetical protein n=1 Tax=Streptomyces sp. NPDC050145 TaxID=3365602 RepID=UPI0037ABFF1D